MKIITCAGYYGTGSSAVTDLMGEFDNIHFMGDYEFRFIQDPGGIADLEYNIVENYHRHNSGHALKRYKKNVDFLAGNKFVKKYEGFFNGQFKKVSYEYINELTAFTFKGYWHQDVIDKGMLVWYTERILDKVLNRVIVPIIRGKNNIEPISIHLLRNEITYVPHSDPERFYNATKRYIKRLFEIANVNNKMFVMVDQLVPPSNTQKYCRYFDNIKILSVDRDPRDLFLMEKYMWKGGVLPVAKVEDFCEWFKLTRRHRQTESDDPDKVMRLQFEDMVYHYDDSVKNIAEFIGLSQASHVAPRTKFIPMQSIKNTQIWKHYPEHAQEIEIIEKELSQYCYKNF